MILETDDAKDKIQEKSEIETNVKWRKKKSDKKCNIELKFSLDLS